MQRLEEDEEEDEIMEDEHVKAVLASYAAEGSGSPGVIPTEYLQEDNIDLELPPSMQRAPARIFQCIAAVPAGMLVLVFAIATISQLWVIASAPTLFSARTNLRAVAKSPDLRQGAGSFGRACAQPTGIRAAAGNSRSHPTPLALFGGPRRR